MWYRNEQYPNLWPQIATCLFVGACLGLAIGVMMMYEASGPWYRMAIFVAGIAFTKFMGICKDIFK